MGIFKNLFGGSKGDEKVEAKPMISEAEPDFATRSISANLREQLGKEPRDFNGEDFAQIRQVNVAGVWNGRKQQVFMQELRLFPNLEQVHFTDVEFCPRDMYNLRQNKNQKLCTLIFERCYFSDALRLDDIYERFVIIDCRYRKDMKFWGNYPNLRELVLRGGAGENWDGRFLEKLTNLRYLEISGIGMVDQGCLERIESLEELCVYNSNIICQEILDCPNLKRVSAWEPLYRELMQAKEEGKCQAEVIQAENPCVVEEAVQV